MNFFVFCLAAFSLNSLDRVYKCIKFSIYGALIASVYVFVEKMIGYNFFSSFADLNTNIGIVAAENKYRDGVLRVQGGFEHPLALVQYYLVVIPLLLSGVFFKGKKNFIPFVMLIGFFFFIAASMAMVRTFYVALLLGLVLYFVIRFLWFGRSIFYANERFILVLGLAPFVFFVALYKIYDMALLGSGAEISSTMTRFAQLYNGFVGVSEQPLLGHGIGMATKVIVTVGENYPDTFIIWNEAIDNLFLSVALDSGIPAVLFYMMVFISSIYSGFTLFKNKANHEIIRNMSMSMSIAIFCSFVSMSVLSIFTVLPFVFFVMGALCAVSALSKSNKLEL
ncbi:O-antigen ligase family protein [Marinobacterium sp. YM272]|uniref:O-antigen ligase family protein n=1 Tax=Marinobacterium sp. YM272 TaxID=3421654 RepID=UPI003D7F7A70